MLSICIPTYNYDVTELVMELNKQATTNMLDCEILIADDSSNNIKLKEKNVEAAKKYKTKFIALDKNVGRAAIRNLLALKAGGEFVLFLDCDTIPVGNDFILKYYHAMENDVVVGGIAYRDVLHNAEVGLRWTYGHGRESKSADERSKMPYASFMTGNFMIKRSVFQLIKFDENITQYGHEDTLFGIELKQHDIKINHINNPVYHEGLESNEVFILKTKKGIENLVKLSNSSEYKTDLQNHIKLLHTFIKLRKAGMVGIVALVFRNNEQWFIKNLNKKEPNLKIFNFFKLGYMCYVSLKD
ncbi:MAG: glycosyltransferase family 2 protein [Prolixibacteraceae bacterium]|jgi:glycosyltransferase involved in cell wall biosynthesis|nr:glycosyltransferase family 2 protein [Prolixibacteraceae bacterium]